ncbi:MAG: hypothetical protein JXA93_20635 [Anaerolineae bacterium]|nr:hypothetical protein [Anaerolineae bacterium]
MEPVSSVRNRRRTHLAVVALYAMLALVTTWPLARHLFTHVPGSYTWAFDEYTFVWNTWWFRYSVFNLGQSPLYTTHIFYPLGISLVLYTYNLFNALLSLPLQPFLPLPAISNLIFLLTTVVSAYGTFLLVGYQLRETGIRYQEGGAFPNSLVSLFPAFLAGLIYGIGSYRMVYAAMGHYDMWSTAWIPLYALYLLRTVREPGWRNALLAGVLFVLALLAEMILGVFLALLSLILVGFALLRQRREPGEVAGGGRALVGRLAVAVLVAVLLYLPLAVPILREMSAGYELAGWGDAEKLSVDLAGLVTPTPLHPLGGEWVETLRETREGTARFRDVNTVFLGWAGLALAVVGTVAYRRRLAAWITSFVVFTLFSLGPLLQINGRSLFNLDGLEVNVPLPFILLHYLPVIKANRVPNRFSVVLMLALAVLAGFGVHWFMKVASEKRQGRGGLARRVRTFLPLPLGLFLAFFVVFEHWSVPLPLTDARIPEVYDEMAADPDDYAILQLPMGWRNSFGVQGAESTLTEYYQTYHQKRLLSGNISRNPPYKFDYFRQVPILDALITIQTYGEVDGERRAADREGAGEFVSFYDVRYVVVAPGVPGRPPYVDTRDEAVAYVEEVLPVEKVYDRDGWLLYRVAQPARPQALAVDVGSEERLADMVVGEGWAGAEVVQGATARWAVAQEAQLFLPSAPGSDYQLGVGMLPFDYPGAPEQGARLIVNGERLMRVRVAPGWNVYRWDVPEEALRAGLNDVRLEFDQTEMPGRVLAASGAIGSTGVRAPVPIEVNSGGAAGFAYITLGEAGDEVDGSVHSPGYNVALVDARNGRLVERAGFDTTPTGSEAQAAALAEYLWAIPNGRIVVVAVQGDGGARLTDEAVAALGTIGAQQDLRGTEGWSHAIVGVKGAAPGTAAEVAGPEGGWLRVAADWRPLAAAIDSLRWERVE